jgi:adenine-specific DNA-methyltransferase
MQLRLIKTKDIFIANQIVVLFPHFQKLFFPALQELLVTTSQLKAQENKNEKAFEAALKKFLQNSFYTKNYIGNQPYKKGEADLVILQNTDIQSNTTVLCEVKSPLDRTAMVSQADFNKKSLHQAITYFFIEIIEKKNFDLKRIIITNAEDFFIFDATEFHRIFYHSDLRKSFENWYAKQQVGTSTTDFYTQIANFLSSSNLKEQLVLNCIYFNINDLVGQEIMKFTTDTDFETFANQENFQSLKFLYKIFSPQYLLKQNAESDFNELNKNFYHELLHILGLQEQQEKTRKTITRFPIAKRKEGFLIENAIAKIRYERLEFVAKKLDLQTRFDEHEDDFENALLLSLMWLSRILFLKLLENQLLNYHQQQNEYRFLQADKIKNFGELATLFFQLLNVKPTERTLSLANFENIPYLNSGLFQITYLEKVIGTSIATLRNDLKIPVYEKTVLKVAKNTELYPLEYLLKFLDAYDFGAETRSEVQTGEEKVLINAAVLGKIFEKLNGYKDGSFFTPSFITSYMCKETLQRTVLQRFNEKLGKEFTTYEDLKNFTHSAYRKEDIIKYNEIVNAIKICDPAVGSGHFLVSMLNELLHLKSDLDILHTDGKKLPYWIQAVNDELQFIPKDFENTPPFKYEVFTDNQGNITAHEIMQFTQMLLFAEKKTLIENCLYGVDINPNSVQICRLRMWIELLKSAYYTLVHIPDSGIKGKKPVKLSREMQTLPNLEYKIVEGNSLLPMYENLPVSIKSLDIIAENSQNIVQKIQDAVSLIRTKQQLVFSTDDYYEKLRLISAIERAKADLIIARFDIELQSLQQLVEKFKPENRVASQLSPKEEKEQIELTEQITKLKKLQRKLDYQPDMGEPIVFFEWSIDFGNVIQAYKNGQSHQNGFDIVIGNPPYGLYNKKQNQKIALEEDKETILLLKKKFPEAADGMLNAARLFFALGFRLLNNTGINAMIIPLGILTDTQSAVFRRYIFENYSFISADIFPERDNAQKRVFEEVKMSTAIVICGKQKSENDFEVGLSYTRQLNTLERLNLNFNILKNLDNELVSIPIASPKDFELLQKIYENPKIKRLGELTTCLTGEVDMSLGKKAISQNDKDFPLIKGVQIDKYVYKKTQDEISQGEIEFLNLEEFQKIYKGEKLQHKNSQRIVLQGLTGVNETYRLKATLIESNHFLANSCNYLLCPKHILPEFLIGLLNSDLMNFVFKCRSTSSNVNGYEIDKLPIILPDNQEVIASIVKQIMVRKAIDRKAFIGDLEQTVNEKVWELFGLSM